MGLRWYALHTQPYREAQVADLLTSRGVAIFLPMIPAHHRRLGAVQRPLFPSYLFAQFDVEASGLATVQWTPGLNYVVALGDRPVPIPDEVIVALQERVRAICAQGGIPMHHFRPGDRVVITGGPLRGLEAVFQGPMRPSERVRLLVEFLGQIAPVEVSIADVAAPRARPDADAASLDDRSTRGRRTRGKGRRIRSTRTS